MTDKIHMHGVAQPAPVAWRFRYENPSGSFTPWSYRATEVPAFPDRQVEALYAALPPAAPVETISDEGVIKAAGAMVRLGQERRKLEAPMPTRGEEARACIETYLASLRANSPTQCSAGNDDLPERLRAYGRKYGTPGVCIEAATEIENLRHDLDRHIQIATDIANEPQAVPLPEHAPNEVYKFLSRLGHGFNPSERADDGKREYVALRKVWSSTLTRHPSGTNPSASDASAPDQSRNG